MQSCREKLVTDNLRLVYFCYRKLQTNALTVRYKDDLISEGMLGLVKAANSFEPDIKTKFATYAIMCIRNQMLMFIRKVNKFMPYEVSLFKPIGHDNYGNELSLADIIEDETQVQEDAIERMELTEFTAKQKPIDQKILSALEIGYKQREIAAEIGISQSYVSRRIRKMRSRYVDFCS